MRIENPDISVSSSPDVKIDTFGVKNSARALVLLSNNLYSNKLLAVVREVSTNAEDACVYREALYKKNENTEYHAPSGTPVYITLPTLLTPQLKIRDYGVGLDPEEIKNIYTVYFESTKSDDDEAAGAYGLGCKSPFAYTDNFLVTSTKNGHRWVYSMFIGETGGPELALLSDGPVGNYTTDDLESKNGVEVSVEINESDIRAIEDTVRERYRYCKKPVIVDHPDFFYKTIKDDEGNETRVEKEYAATLIRIKNALMSERSSGYYYEKPNVVMANVSYPLDIRELGLPDYLKLLAEHIRCMYVNTGDVETSLSREELGYTEKTKAKIREYLDDIYKTISSGVSFIIEEALKIENRFELIDYLFDKFEKSTEIQRRIANRELEKHGLCSIPNDRRVSFDMIRRPPLASLEREKVSLYEKTLELFGSEDDFTLASYNYNFSRRDLLKSKEHGNVYFTKHIVSGREKDPSVVLYIVDVRRGKIMDSIKSHASRFGYNSTMFYVLRPSAKSKVKAEEIKSLYQGLGERTEGVYEIGVVFASEMKIEKSETTKKTTPARRLIYNNEMNNKGYTVSNDSLFDSGSRSAYVFFKGNTAFYDREMTREIHSDIVSYYFRNIRSRIIAIHITDFEDMANLYSLEDEVKKHAEKQLKMRSIKSAILSSTDIQNLVSSISRIDVDFQTKEIDILKRLDRYTSSVSYSDANAFVRVMSILPLLPDLKESPRIKVYRRYTSAISKMRQEMPVLYQVLSGSISNYSSGEFEIVIKALDQYWSNKK